MLKNECLVLARMQEIHTPTRDCWGGQFGSRFQKKKKIRNRYQEPLTISYPVDLKSLSQKQYEEIIKCFDKDLIQIFIPLLLILIKHWK